MSNFTVIHMDNSNIIGHLKWLSCHHSLLVSGTASGALKELERIKRDNSIMREALDKIACWQDGFEVNGCFDEPCSAYIARQAIGQCEEVE